MTKFDGLLALPGTPQEQARLKERLETLSLWEEIVLSAEVRQNPPETAKDAVLRIWSLPGHSVCFPAGNDRQLGEYYLWRQAEDVESLLPYVDLEKVGRWYREKHPGCFAENCYVAGAGLDVSPWAGEGLPEDPD